jgi:dihydroneopterin aldolase/2-amino-4-hydroxy-6-hydroxymethyldihydropteridine diphosphokinase
MNALDTIHINDLRVLTVIGALAHEQEQPQPLRVDIDLHVDLVDAGRSDDLDDTVHYGLVSEQIAHLASDRSFVLLERFADEIAGIALRFDRVEAVDVTVTKIRPPLALVVESTAVTLHRRRSDASRRESTVHKALIALGSNLGDRRAYLRTAVAELGGVVGTSQVFETAPIGGPDDQGAYLNMVVEVETSLDPFALLRRCQRIEAEAGRQRTVHWGPRTLDVDILFYDEITLDSAELVIPHPRIGERRFVLAPLEELAPDRCPAGWREALPPDEVTPRGSLER